MGIFDSFFGGDAPELQLKSTNLTGAYGTGKYNPRKGTVSYNLAPEIQAMRDIFYGGAQEFLPTQEGTDFANYLNTAGRDILNQALGMNPQEYAAQLFQQGSDILAPQRQQEASMLADTLFKTGRTGAAIGMGEGYVNPEQYSFQLANAQADKQRLFDTLSQAYDRQNREQLRGLGLMEAGQQQRMLPYAQAQKLFGAGIDLTALSQNDLQNLANFGNMTNQAAVQKYNADMQNWQAGGGGLFSNIVSGIAGGVGSGLGMGLGSGLAGWTKSLFNTPTSTASAYNPGIQLTPASPYNPFDSYNIGGIYGR
jgi:hypothetical protein